TNPAVLAQANIDFSFTLHQLKKVDDFWPNLRRAVKHGLSTEKALAALTTVPAKIAGVSDKAGKIAPGYMADLVIAKGDLFIDRKSRSVWLQGPEVVLEPMHQADFCGTLTVAVGDQTAELTVKDGNNVTGNLAVQKIRHALRTDSVLEFVVDAEFNGIYGAWRIRLEQAAADGFSGVAIAPTGTQLALTAQRTERSEEHTSELQSRENIVCRLLLE